MRSLSSNSELEPIKHQLAQAQAQLAEAQQEVDQLKQELETTKNERDQARADYDKLQSSSSQVKGHLQQQLRELREQLEEAETKLAKPDEAEQDGTSDSPSPTQPKLPESADLLNQLRGRLNKQKKKLKTDEDYVKVILEILEGESG